MERLSDLLELRFQKFNTITNNALVSDALYQMCSENMDYLVVLNEEGRFQGVISDHDIATKVLFATRPLNRIEAREFMNRCLPVAESDNSIQYGLQLIEKYSALHLAVFDSFDFRGVISARELMQHMQKCEFVEEAWDVKQDYPYAF